MAKAAKITKAQASAAIWLRREGQHAVVLIEVGKGQWVELIRENIDGPFSHIIEPSGIARCSASKS